MVLELSVEYPRQTDPIVVEPDDRPCGAVVAGHFIAVRFEAGRAVLRLPGQELEIAPGQVRRFAAAGVPVVATLR